MINFFIAQSTSVQIFMLAAHAVVVLLLAIGCMRWLGTWLQGRKDLVPGAIRLRDNSGLLAANTGD